VGCFEQRKNLRSQVIRSRGYGFMLLFDSETAGILVASSSNQAEIDYR
jgi:hypothetical protein